MDPAIDSSLSTPPPPPPAFMQPEPPVISVVPQAEQPKKPSKKKLALVIASILVLLGSIGGGVILVRMRSQPQISAAACDDNERWAHITADWAADNGATVTNSSSSCTYDISLASYSFYAWSDQTLFDHVHIQVGPGQTSDIKVNLPNCKAQLDLFFGTEPVPANHSFPDYANKGLIKWKHVGETNCAVGPSATPTVPAGPSATPTPTTPTSQAPSCPAGTTRLFSTAGVNLSVGSVVGGNGRITAANGSWNTESRNGVVLARGGFDMTVTFPISTTLTTALIYDNDPNSGETGWSINGVTLPTTANETWGPAFTLNITTTTLNFLNGDDSPHFNVCFRQTTPSATPTPTPTPVVTVTPGPSATPTPTVTPGPSPTPGPSSTPTPGPSATPGPSSTPGPTATRTPNTPTPVTQLAESGSITQTWLTIITGIGILGLGLLLAL